MPVASWKSLHEVDEVKKLENEYANLRCRFAFLDDFFDKDVDNAISDNDSQPKCSSSKELINEKGDDSQNVYCLDLEWDLFLDDDDDEHIDASPEKLASRLEVVWNLKHITRFMIEAYPHRSIPYNRIGRLTTLKEFRLVDCLELKHLPSDVGLLVNLTKLTIDMCNKLESLPPEIGNMKNLQKLVISRNQALRTLPSEMGRLSNLQYLEILSCDSLVYLPAQIGQLHQLIRIKLEELNHLQALPASLFASLFALKCFILRRCSRLTSIMMDDNRHHYSYCANEFTTTTTSVTAFGRLGCLEEVSINWCPQLQHLSVALQAVPNLKRLDISRIPRTTVLNFFSAPWIGTTDATKIIKMDSDLDWNIDGTSTCPEGIGLGSDYPLILPGLPKSLEELNLINHGIEDLDGFLQEPPPWGGLPRGIRLLRLWGNPILKSTNKKDQLSLLKLLQQYPRLGTIDCYHLAGKDVFTGVSHFLMNFNRCGRHLLSTDKPIPLSLWPLVLSNVTKLVAYVPDSIGATIPASIIFSLLHGPALLNREHGRFPPVTPPSEPKVNRKRKARVEQ